MAIKITQLGRSATPTRRYGSFTGRTPSGGGRAVGRVTQLKPSVTPGRRYGSFAGRAPSGGGTGTGTGISRGLVVNNAMEVLKQSTSRNKMILLVDSADHITGKTGLALSINLSKDGGAFATITPTVTDRGFGCYNIALTPAHTDTLGDFWLHITAAGADPLDVPLVVELDRPGATVSSVTNPEGFKRNTAFNNFTFPMVLTDGVTAAPGLTVTAQVCIDGAAYVGCANAVSEVGSGTYKINLAAADLNGAFITLKFTATGAATLEIPLKTAS